MKPWKSLSVVLSLAAATAVAAPPAPDTPLIEDGASVVSVNDLAGYLLKMPEKVRGEAMASYQSVASMVDAVFLNRMFANKAKALGLDKHPAVQARLVQVQELFLADLYFQDLERKIVYPDLEPRARELYVGEPDRYTTKEHVKVQRIIVSFLKRTQETALDRAQKARAEALASGTKEGFLAAAAKWSDESELRRHNGDLGLMGARGFPDPVADAIARLKKGGDVTEPIELDDGYHIIRLEERVPGKLVPFADVVAPLVAGERDRIAKDRRTAEVNEVRNSKTVVVHKANVDSLVNWIDPAEIARKAAEAQRR